MSSLGTVRGSLTLIIDDQQVQVSGFEVPVVAVPVAGPPGTQRFELQVGGGALVETLRAAVISLASGLDDAFQAPGPTR